MAGGRLVVRPSVYRLPGTPVTREQRLLAAVLAAGPGAVASHRSAARLWRLWDDAAAEHRSAARLWRLWDDDAAEPS